MFRRRKKWGWGCFGGWFFGLGGIHKKEGGGIGNSSTVASFGTRADGWKSGSQTDNKRAVWIGNTGKIKELIVSVMTQSVLFQDVQIDAVHRSNTEEIELNNKGRCIKDERGRKLEGASASTQGERLSFESTISLI